MRLRAIVAALLIPGFCPLVAQLAAAPMPTASEVIARMSARDAQRDAASGGYTGNRQYFLENSRFGKYARMAANEACAPDGTKILRVVSEEGWKSANSHVLREMLDSESETSRPLMRGKVQITADNYAFQMVGTDALGGRQTYVIDVIPKRDEPFLIRGRIWVDAEEYALARVEGQPAKNPSLWIRSVHFTQEYRKSGAYWFPSSTTSISEAHLFGKTEVTIHYFDYQPCAETAVRHAGLPPKEASYVEYEIGPDSGRR